MSVSGRTIKIIPVAFPDGKTFYQITQGDKFLGNIYPEQLTSWINKMRNNLQGCDVLILFPTQFGNAKLCGNYSFDNFVSIIGA